MRLIDADELKQTFYNDKKYNDEKYKGSLLIGFAFDKMINVIDNAPTINSEDLRPKCTWEQIYEDEWECSNCGACWTCIDGDPTDNDMHFCPVCGAEIDWSEEE